MARPLRAESVFRALAHAKRRRILLALLGDGETPAGEILPPHELTRPALSQHLGALREAGLVTFRQRGNRLLYRTNTAALGPLREFLGRMDRASRA